MNSIYIGLVHFPVYNKNGSVITSAITNYDIHDIARTARTYGLKRYFIIHPLDQQMMMAQDIVNYWNNGFGAEYNPDRAEALSRLQVVRDIESAVDIISAAEGCKPIIITTDARQYPNTKSYSQIRHIITNESVPVLLLFGTAWGITNEVMEKFDYILEPIYGSDDYNHLCVRSAVAIILDRLLGEAWWVHNG